MNLGDAAFTGEQVMRITGISRRRLAYWLSHGIITADVDAAHGRGHVRLWSFRNLVEVRAALWLRENVSLQLLGKVVHKLRRQGLSAPLADVRVGIVESRGGPRVLIQRADGTWEEGHTGQVVMELVLPFGRFQEEVSKAVTRDRRAQRRPGEIERRRGRLGSTPVFVGTRVPVAAVKRLRGEGWPAKRIVAEFPGLTLADVQAAEAQVG